MTIAVRMSAIFILFCCALVIATYPAWAEDATSTGTRKERVKERIETRKENVQERVASLKERLASKEAALKARLEAFKDKRKAQITEKVSTNLNKINENHTDHMLKFLDKASAILTKLEERVSRGTADIKGTAAAKEAIASAKESIASAKAAVQAQADKDYTVIVTSEGRVRTDVKAMRDKLHTDLKAVREQVIVAKQAVANAIRVAKSGKVEIPGKEATRSGQ